MFKKDKNKTDKELENSFKRTVAVLIVCSAIMIADIGYILYQIFTK